MNRSSDDSDDDRNKKPAAESQYIVNDDDNEDDNNATRYRDDYQEFINWYYTVKFSFRDGEMDGCDAIGDLVELLEIIEDLIASYKAQEASTTNSSSTKHQAGAALQTGNNTNSTTAIDINKVIVNELIMLQFKCRKLLLNVATTSPLVATSTISEATGNTIGDNGEEEKDQDIDMECTKSTEIYDTIPARSKLVKQTITLLLHSTVYATGSQLQQQFYRKFSRAIHALYYVPKQNLKLRTDVSFTLLDRLKQIQQEQEKREQQKQAQIVKETQQQQQQEQLSKQEASNSKNSKNSETSYMRSIASSIMNHHLSLLRIITRAKVQYEDLFDNDNDDNSSTSNSSEYNSDISSSSNNSSRIIKRFLQSIPSTAIEKFPHLYNASLINYHCMVGNYLETIRLATIYLYGNRYNAETNTYKDSINYSSYDYYDSNSIAECTLMIEYYKLVANYFLLAEHDLIFMYSHSASNPQLMEMKFQQMLDTLGIGWYNGKIKEEEDKLQKQITKEELELQELERQQAIQEAIHQNNSDSEATDTLLRTTRELLSTLRSNKQDIARDIKKIQNMHIMNAEELISGCKNIIHGESRFGAHMNFTLFPYLLINCVGSTDRNRLALFANAMPIVAATQQQQQQAVDEASDEEAYEKCSRIIVNGMYLQYNSPANLMLLYKASKIAFYARAEKGKEMMQLIDQLWNPCLIANELLAQMAMHVYVTTKRRAVKKQGMLSTRAQYKFASDVIIQFEHKET